MHSLLAICISNNKMKKHEPATMTFPSALKKSSVQSYFLTFLKNFFYPIYDSQRNLQTTYLTHG